MLKKIIIGFLIIILIIFLLLVALIFLIIKDNPDFAPYTEKEYDTVYEITSDIYDLPEIKNEMTNIAQKYEQDIKLTEIKYYLENKDNGTVTFIFYKSFPPENKACSISIDMDIATKKTQHILYEKGHGKRISGCEYEIVKPLNTDMSPYINDANNIFIHITNFGVSKNSYNPKTR